MKIKIDNNIFLQNVYFVKGIISECIDNMNREEFLNNLSII